MYEIEFAAQGNIFDVVLAGGQIYEIEFVAHLPTRHEFGISCLGLLENCNRGLECSVVLSHFFKLTLNVYWHSFEVSIAWRQRSLKAGLVEQSLKQGCELRCGKLQLYFRGGRFPNFHVTPGGGCVGGVCPPPISRIKIRLPDMSARFSLAVILASSKHIFLISQG